MTIWVSLGLVIHLNLISKLVQAFAIKNDNQMKQLIAYHKFTFYNTHTSIWQKHGFKMATILSGLDQIFVNSYLKIALKCYFYTRLVCYWYSLVVVLVIKGKVCFFTVGWNSDNGLLKHKIRPSYKYVIGKIRNDSNI